MGPESYVLKMYAFFGIGEAAQESYTSKRTAKAAKASKEAEKAKCVPNHKNTHIALLSSKTHILVATGKMGPGGSLFLIRRHVFSQFKPLLRHVECQSPWG